MALNPVETLNVFDPDLRTELRNRSISTNLVRTRAPFIRFTTAANMDDLSTSVGPTGERLPGGLGPQFEEYKGYSYFTLGLHGFENIDYGKSDLYGTQSNKGLVIGTTYKRGEQKLVYTYGGGQVTTQNARGAIIVTAAQSARNYPPPGIVNAKVERLRNGNVLRFTLEIYSYTQEQLRVLDSVCFVPGMTCILEWGTTSTTKDGPEKIINKLDFKDTVQVGTYIREANRLSRTDFINSWCKPNKFNYDFAVANIANVKTQVSDNIYKTTVVAYGKADNLMYISAYATTNPLDPTLIDREKAVISSINEYFKLNGKFSSTLKYILKNPTAIPERYRTKIVRFRDDVDRAEQQDNVPTSMSTGATNDLGFEDAYFISMDFFVDIILNNSTRDGLLGIVNLGLSRDNQLSALISSLTNNPANPEAPNSDTIYVGYNKNLRSTSPEVMIIHNPRARANVKTRAIKDSLAKQISPSGSITNLPGYLTGQRGATENRRTIAETISLLQKQPFGQNVTTDSGIAPLSQGVWINSKAIQAAFLNARTIMEGMETLLRNINAATENYWDLKLYYDDDKQQFRILDDNVRVVRLGSKDKIYEFNKKLNSLEEGTIGPDVLNIEIATDYPKLLFAQLAISGINGGRLISDPQRKDVDFRGSTSVRDIFTDDPIQPRSEAPSVNRRGPVETMSVASFVDNLFGQRTSFGTITKQTFLTTLSSQFQLTIPNSVAQLLRDLFQIQTLLTTTQAVDFRNRLAVIKANGELSEQQSVVLTTIFANRAKSIITQLKETEKNNYKVAYESWKDRASNLSRSINVINEKIDASRDAFLKKIDDVITIAKTPEQVQREESQARAAASAQYRSGGK